MQRVSSFSRALSNTHWLEWLRALLLLAVTAGLLLLPPLLGVWLSGQDVTDYLIFPPHPEIYEQPGFSWPVFLLIAVVVLLSVMPFLYRLLTVPKYRQKTQSTRMPLWGWIGLIVTAFAWWVAWSRSEVAMSIYGHSFPLLWLGYILVMNALAVRRSGSCLMLAHPLRFLLLFPVSGVFWWFFEYLNLFVKNWYYVDAGVSLDRDPLIAPTLAFATVLPAVASTIYWLSTFKRLNDASVGYWSLRLKSTHWAGWVLLATLLSLIGLGGWPQHVYPLVWISPLLILLAILTLRGHATVFESMAEGDWRPFWLAALAGLICGFFWELWNYGSLLRWEYSVPYVDRFLIFEMPLLGYAGYLPFGLECILIVSLLWGADRKALFAS